MGDYSKVKDEDRNVLGIWLKNRNDAKDRLNVAAHVMRMNLPKAIRLNALAGMYRVVPNSYDDQGGCFVMFGDAPAPGEESFGVPLDTPAPSKKRWWQFWKK